MPAWKLRAIERGAIPDPRIKATSDRKPEKRKAERKSDSVGPGRSAVWVKPDVCTKIQRLAVYMKMPPATTLGEVVERLVLEKMERFQSIEEMLERMQQGE